jgi:hypothetical protein
MVLGVGVSYLTNRAFWAGATERAVRTSAWVLGTALGMPQAGQMVGLDVLHVGWQDSLSLAAGGALLSLLGSVAAGKAGGPDGSASLVQDRPGDAAP